MKRDRLVSKVKHLKRTKKVNSFLRLIEIRAQKNVFDKNKIGIPLNGCTFERWILNLDLLFIRKNAKNTSVLILMDDGSLDSQIQLI